MTATFYEGDDIDNWFEVGEIVHVDKPSFIGNATACMTIVAIEMNPEPRWSLDTSEPIAWCRSEKPLSGGFKMTEAFQLSKLRHGIRPGWEEYCESFLNPPPKVGFFKRLLRRAS